MVKRKVSDAVKKQVAGRQRYTCSTIYGYQCPMNGKPFDESGYDIDHIKELRDGGTNDLSNLQALCVSCHRVKTTRNTTKTTVVPKKHDEDVVKRVNAIVNHIHKEVLIGGRIFKLLTRTH